MGEEEGGRGWGVEGGIVTFFPLLFIQVIWIWISLFPSEKEWELALDILSQTSCLSIGLTPSMKPIQLI